MEIDNAARIKQCLDLIEFKGPREILIVRRNRLSIYYQPEWWTYTVTLVLHGTFTFKIVTERCWAGHDYTEEELRGKLLDKLEKSLRITRARYGTVKQLLRPAKRKQI